MYKNMLPVGLSVVTDKTSEYALIAILALEQITIVSTQTAAGGADPATTASVGDGAPADAQPTTNAGQVETQGVGSQAFAGAYEPGNFNVGTYNPDGGTVGNGSFGFGPLPGGLSYDPNLSGLSPPMSITLPELSVTAPEGVSGLQAAGPDQYNIFGGGP